MWNLESTVYIQNYAYTEEGSRDEDNGLTSSAGLDKKHLWLVLEQRTVRIVKSFEDPVQLKNDKVTYVGYKFTLKRHQTQKE